MFPVMKLKISKKHQAKVLRFKKLIAANRHQEDLAYAQLIKQMGLTIAQDDILFDYVYNDCELGVELE